jgi:hypothetical protein
MPGPLPGQGAAGVAAAELGGLPAAGADADALGEHLDHVVGRTWLRKAALRPAQAFFLCGDVLVGAGCGRCSELASSIQAGFSS